MAPRKKKETPKIKEEHIEEERVVPDAARQLIASLEQQVRNRAEDLLAMRAALRQTVKEEFQLQMIKLPKQVRDMPLKQFKEEYGGDITSVLLQEMERRLAGSAAMPVTALRTRAKPATALPTQRQTRLRGIAAETPAAGISMPAQLGTVMRAPQGQEILYSKNGTPLGFLEQKAGLAPVLRTTVKSQQAALSILPSAGNTVLHPPRPGSRTGVADSLTITLKSGEHVQVDFDGGLDSVPEHQRDEVVAHLTALTKLATSVTGGRRRR